MIADRSTDRAGRPILRHGFRIPFDELDPDSFQSFTFGVLAVAGSRLGLKVAGQPSGTGDGGFDVEARRILDGALVCIQCKRYQAAIGTNDLAVELAKVALRSTLDGASVAEHWLISTGKIANVVRTGLRSQDRVAIATAAVKACADLKALADQVKAVGLDVEQIVRDYVAATEISVLGGAELDNLLATAWLEIASLLEKFFVVERVLVEHPRPDFDEFAYLRQPLALPSNLIPLEATVGSAPPIVASSAENPLSDDGNVRPLRDLAGPVDEVLDSLLDPTSPDPVLLTGVGGSGKSTCLAMLHNRLLERRIEDDHHPLPIFIRLRRYDGDLDSLIHRAINVRFGHWKSVPGRLVLLIDGLNEIPPQQASTFADDLHETLRDPRVRCVVSTRPGTSARPIIVRPSEVVTIQPLLPREIDSFCRRILGPSDFTRFVEQMRAHPIFAGSSLLRVPFGLAAALDSFKRRGSLPPTSIALVAHILDTRFDRNTQTVDALPQSARDVPRAAIERLAQEVAFEAAFSQGSIAVRRAELERVIVHALDRVREQRVFGAEVLRDADTIPLLVHFGLILPSQNGWFEFEHEIILDALAASVLAGRWKKYTGNLRDASRDHAWIFAAPLIALAERCEFLDVLWTFNAPLFARAAREMGPSIVDVAAEKADIALVSTAEDEFLRKLHLIEALAILGGDRAQSRLRVHAGDLRKAEGIAFQAAYQLVGLGHEEVAAYAFRSAEEHQGDPSHSGGWKDVWGRTPFPLALRLARERLAAWPDQQKLLLSIDSVGQFGDAHDVRALRAVALQTKDGYTRLRALQAVFRLEPKEGRTLFADLSASGLSLHALVELRCAVLWIDRSFEPELILDYIVAYTKDEKVDDAMDGSTKLIMRRCRDVLAKVRLDLAFERALVTAYDSASDEGKYSLWGIAVDRRLVGFDAIAAREMGRLQAPFIGYLLRFGAVRGPDFPHIGALLERVRSLRGSKELEEEWCGIQLMKFLVAVAADRDAAAFANATLKRALDREDRIRADTRDETCNVFELSDSLNLILPATRLVERLDRSLIPRVLRSNMLANLGDAQARALSHFVGSVSSAEIDDVLRDTSFKRFYLGLLHLLSHLEPTPRRLSLLRREVMNAESPHYADFMARIILRWWSDEVAAMAVDFVLTDPWGSRGAPPQFDSGGLIVAVAEALSYEQAQNLVRPALSRATNVDTKHVLKFWYDVATMRSSGATSHQA